MPWQSSEATTGPATAWGSLRVRLTILNTAVVLVAMALVAFAVRFGVRSALFHDADEEMRAAVRETTLAIRELDDTSLVIAELRRKTESRGEREWFVQLLDGPDSTIWKSDNCPTALLSKSVDESVSEKVDQIGRWRWARRRVNAPPGPSMYVRIGMSTDVIEKEVDDLLWFLFPIGAVCLVLTPLAGSWLALRATRPIGGILATASRLQPTRLGDRLATTGTGDELDRLSATINRLLDEVAKHVERQQQFVADAAHELRGPLAAMQSSLEVAVARPRAPESYRSTLEDVLSQTRHLSKLANDLLLLAEEGASDPLSNVENVCDLDRIASQTVSMFAGAAEERSIDLSMRSAGPTEVQGDVRQYRQVMSNLIDNALRFTPSGGHVVLSVGADDRHADAVVTVADDGVGIAPADLERVFDRFFQADASRDRGDATRGGGLGLSICRSIVERHGGRIVVESPGPAQGTTVTVRLPLLPATEPSKSQRSKSGVFAVVAAPKTALSRPS